MLHAQCHYIHSPPVFWCESRIRGHLTKITLTHSPADKTVIKCNSYWEKSSWAYSPFSNVARFPMILNGVSMKRPFHLQKREGQSGTEYTVFLIVDIPVHAIMG